MFVNFLQIIGVVSACDSSKSVGFRQIPVSIDTAGIIFELVSKKKIATKDARNFDIKNALNYQVETLERLERTVLNVGDDISKIVSVVNRHFQENILELSKEQLSINADKIGSLIERNALNFLRNELKDNIFVQFLVIKTV